MHHTQYFHRSTMSNVNTPLVRKRAPLSTRSSSLRCICSRAPHCRTVLQKRKEKTPKAFFYYWQRNSKSPKKRSIMEYSQGVPQDTMSLRSGTGKHAKMLLKGHLGIKCHFQYIKVIRLLDKLLFCLVYRFTSASAFYHPTSNSCIVGKNISCIVGKNTIQYGYRKWRTHAQVLSTTLVHGNSKNEIIQMNRRRR